MGITLIDYNPNALESNLNILVNCLWNPPQRFNSTFSSGEMFGTKLIVTDPNHLEYYMDAGDIISLPTSFEMLYAACCNAARHADSVPQKTGSGRRGRRLTRRIYSCLFCTEPPYLYGFQFKTPLHEVKRSLFSRRVNRRWSTGLDWY